VTKKEQEEEEEKKKKKKNENYKLLQSEKWSLLFQLCLNVVL
jgi:hypothetical protein